MAIGLWPMLLAATRCMGFASIAAAAASPLAVAAAAVLVIAKHRGNIERLLAGTEYRLGSRKG